MVNLNTAGSQSLTTYKALSFDVFGTVLDWETGFYPHLQVVIRQLPEGHALRAPFPPPTPSTSDRPSGPNSNLAAKHPAFVAFDRHESKVMAELPGARYEQLLGYALRDLATELGVEVTKAEMRAAGASQGSWPAFADSAAALARLARHYRLVALSNVSNEAIARALAGPGKEGVRFDAVYTAEDIGSYKPALDNFEYLLGGVEREFGVQKGQLLHVAHGVASDQLPAENIDLDHVWVERGVDNWGENRMDRMKHLRIVSDLKQLADEADKAFAEQTNGM